MRYFSLSGNGGKASTITGKPKEKRKSPPGHCQSAAQFLVVENGDTPGPNNYNLGEEFGAQAPKYSFGTKSFALLDVMPGPSDYNTLSTDKFRYRNAPAATLKTVGHEDNLINGSQRKSC